MNRLTARQAATLPDGMHADGGNLYLQVRYGGKSRAWVFRWKTKGKVRQIGLGRLADRSLKEAREIAAKLRNALLNGQDPAAVYARLTGKTEKLLQKAMAENTPVPELTPEILQAVGQVIRALANGLVESGALPSVSHCNQRKEKEMIGSNLNEPGCSAADGRTAIVREDGTEEGGGNNEA
jgi:hypothetical protein